MDLFCDLRAIAIEIPKLPILNVEKLEFTCKCSVLAQKRGVYVV
jgi:hypothetical protein